MPVTRRMGIPYPAEGADPWFPAFESMMNAMDVALFTEREDRQLFLTGGGVFTFNSTSGVVSWSADIHITAGISGFLWVIPAGSVVVADGQYLVVSLARAPTTNVSVVATSVYQIPSTDAALAVAFRSGSKLYFRNARILVAGESFDIVDRKTDEGGVQTLTYAANSVIDFGGAVLQSVTLAGNITFTTANLMPGRAVSVRVIGDPSIRSLFYPGAWKPIGVALPATLAANKTGVLSLVSWASNDANVLAGFAAEP